MSNHKRNIDAVGKIYTLSDRDGNVFYVGCTILSIEYRLQCHISQAMSKKLRLQVNTKKIQRIRDLNFDIVATIVEIVKIDGSKVPSPKKYLKPFELKWIKKYLNDGCDLCNTAQDMGISRREPLKKEIVGQTFIPRGKRIEISNRLKTSEA